MAKRGSIVTTDRWHIDGIVCAFEVNKDFCHTCQAWVEPPMIEETTHNGVFKRTNFRCPVCHRLLWERMARLKDFSWAK